MRCYYNSASHRTSCVSIFSSVAMRFVPDMPTHGGWCSTTAGLALAACFDAARLPKDMRQRRRRERWAGAGQTDVRGDRSQRASTVGHRGTCRWVSQRAPADWLVHALLGAIKRAQAPHLPEVPAPDPAPPTPTQKKQRQGIVGLLFRQTRLGGGRRRGLCAHLLGLPQLRRHPNRGPRSPWPQRPCCSVLAPSASSLPAWGANLSSLPRWCSPLVAFLTPPRSCSFPA